MTGFYQNSICFPEIQQAIDAHFQAIKPVFIRDSTNDIQFSYLRDNDGIWYLRKSTIDSLGAVTTNYTITATNPNFGTCQINNDPATSFNNGIELGWAVAGVIVVTYVVRRLYRG